VQRLLQYREMIWKDGLVRRAVQPPAAGHTLVGESDAIRGVREQIALAARTSSNVLVTGESGVGKELVARAVHAASARHDGGFVPVNCGRDPRGSAREPALRHLRGAFTTAVQANPGLFATASHGTLSWTRSARWPLQLQVKLLRVIEEKCVLPVGGTKPVPMDARIIASTNRDLEREVEAGRFREDLFYRAQCRAPHRAALRERRGDIPVLVDHLVERLNVKLDARCLGVERTRSGRSSAGRGRATSASSRTSSSGPWSSAAAS